MCSVTRFLGNIIQCRNLVLSDCTSRHQNTRNEPVKTDRKYRPRHWGEKEDRGGHRERRYRRRGREKVGEEWRRRVKKEESMRRREMKKVGKERRNQRKRIQPIKRNERKGRRNEDRGMTRKRKGGDKTGK